VKYYSFGEAQTLWRQEVNGVPTVNEQLTQALKYRLDRTVGNFGAENALA
jgi:hypothetical protein